MNTCSVEGCARQTIARGFCNMHYRRWQKHGDPGKTLLVRPPREANAPPSYDLVHKRLREQRGPAREHPCSHCGEQARFWALVGEPKWLSPGENPYTDDLDAYAPLCGSCHVRLDGGLPPCPHGPERERGTRGECLACARERSANQKRKRYATDPEWREIIKARNRKRRQK